MLKCEEFIKLVKHLRNIDNLDPEFDTIAGKIKSILPNIQIDMYKQKLGNNFLGGLEDNIDYFADRCAYRYKDLIEDALLHGNIIKATNVMILIKKEDYLRFTKNEVNYLIEDCKSNNLQDSLKWIEENKDDLIS